MATSKEEILEVLDRLLDRIDSHSDDFTIFGECRKCALNEDEYRYWDCP